MVQKLRPQGSVGDPDTDLASLVANLTSLRGHDTQARLPERRFAVPVHDAQLGSIPEEIPIRPVIGLPVHGRTIRTIVAG
jgi:hypothetical protein